jgi:hypothetical protein
MNQVHLSRKVPSYPRPTNPHPSSFSVNVIFSGRVSIVCYKVKIKIIMEYSILTTSESRENVTKVESSQNTLKYLSE